MYNLQNCFEGANVTKRHNSRVNVNFTHDWEIKLILSSNFAYQFSKTLMYFLYFGSKPIAFLA